MSAIAVDVGDADDAVVERLLAQNDELASRVQRLAPVLARMARDLAVARRENGELRRENQQLRAGVASGRGPADQASFPGP